ncbi:TPM domain-containing protein [Butyrivibrio sp. AD3002]|uniref:TPM domain-containing protein n=1 Tax=Butyrivibrio sp. AD3002 TaxID=1280670 RepID=UPI0003B370F9|nr:TPM domain-containing protein [Butyrivibrio sp. AD3002]
MKKRYLGWILFLLTIIVMSVTPINVSAEDGVFVPTVKEDIYVYDAVDMISADDEDEINRILDELEEKTSAEVAVISYDDSDLTLEEYANKLFNMLGIGKAEENNGILLLMQKEGNHVRLEIGSGIDDVFTDDVAGDILDNYYVPYRDESTSEAALETAKAVAANMYSYYELESELTGEYEPLIYGNISDEEFAEDDNVYEVEETTESNKIGGIILIVIVGFFVLFVLPSIIEHFEKKKWAKDHDGDMHIWEARERLYHRSSSDSCTNFFDSGSSFGGGDSGSSFGGGSSDGGGASR